MFYDVFKELCEAKKISCKAAAMEMGFSNSTASKWKRTGAVPNGDTLNKVADYFGVSVSYLLSREADSDFDKGKAPTAVQGDERDEPVTPAMDQHHERSMYGAKLLEELTPEKREEALRYLEFLKSQEMK